MIAHEIGHHIQNQLGVLPKVQESQRAVGQSKTNSLQVRVELQQKGLAVQVRQGLLVWLA